MSDSNVLIKNKKGYRMSFVRYKNIFSEKCLRKGVVMVFYSEGNFPGCQCQRICIMPSVCLNYLVFCSQLSQQNVS